MNFDQRFQDLREVFKTPHPEEHVTKTANTYAFQHHHPVLNERQAAHCSKIEATRKQKIEKTQWSSWEDLRPQLCMKACDLHQQRQHKLDSEGNLCEAHVATTRLQTVQILMNKSEHFGNCPRRQTWKDPLGRILRGRAKARKMANCGTSPIR